VLQSAFLPGMLADETSRFPSGQADVLPYQHNVLFGSAGFPQDSSVCLYFFSLFITPILSALITITICSSEATVTSICLLFIFHLLHLA
jgi:hypothetical protein